jgi:hypothetical protein
VPAGYVRGLCSETRIPEEVFEAKRKRIGEFQSKLRRPAGSLANPRAILRGLAVRPAMAPARLHPYPACALERRVSAALGSAG